MGLGDFNAFVCTVLITVSSCKNHKISIGNQICVSLFRIPKYEDETKYLFLCTLAFKSCDRFFMRYHHYNVYHYGVTRVHFIPQLYLDYAQLKEMRYIIPKSITRIYTPEIEKFHEDFKVRWLIGSHTCADTSCN